MGSAHEESAREQGGPFYIGRRTEGAPPNVFHEVKWQRRRCTMYD